MPQKSAACTEDLLQRDPWCQLAPQYTTYYCYQHTQKGPQRTSLNVDVFNTFTSEGTPLWCGSAWMHSATSLLATNQGSLVNDPATLCPAGIPLRYPKNLKRNILRILYCSKSAMLCRPVPINMRTIVIACQFGTIGNL